jgi:hypothetical protein
MSPTTLACARSAAPAVSCAVVRGGVAEQNLDDVEELVGLE